MKKRLIAMITVLALIVSALFCFNVSIAFGADSGTCGATGSSVTWSYDSSTTTLTITGTGVIADYGLTVVKRAPWYSYKSNITTIIIGEGITEIGELDFYNCTALTSVSLPSTLTTIAGNSLNYGAFRECTALESITLPQNLTTIEAMAFRGCTALKSITLPDSLTSFGTGAFQDCTDLTTVKYGTGLTSTGSSAFKDAGVKNIIFSSTITRIDEYSFFGCKMTSVEIPELITSIGTRSFANCSFLSSVTIYNTNTTFEGISVGEEDPFNGSSQKITFYGHKGSTTETFVAEHPNSDYEFVSIDSCDHPTTHEVITLQATCTESGTTTQVCDVCGFVVSTTEIPATGHSWELIETLDETEANGHILRNYHCSSCNEDKQEIEHVAFVDGFYDYTNTATCTTRGYETYTCTFEGCGKVERNLVLTANHTVEEYTVTLEPTCTEPGSEEGVCTVCGETVVREISALGHQNELTETLDNTLDDGHTYELYTCTVCGEETIVSEHVEWLEGCYTSVTRESPSCSLPGLSYDTCTICSKTRLATIPATGEHVWYETSRIEPTCTADGQIAYACENCNSTKTESIEKLGHDYVLQSSEEPTCTTAGYKNWKCSRCGYLSKDVINATGHTVDELNYTIIADADCVNDGTATSVCKVCGNEFEITLVALGHIYEDVIVPIAEKPGHSLS
ncbi:MAG: leucine-rich repeat domain-containing protein, partial [Eubacterium sp.]